MGNSSTRLVMILALLALLVAACGDGSTGGDTTSDDTLEADVAVPSDGVDTAGEGDSDAVILPFEPAGPESAPLPSEPGPFPVGVISLSLEDPARVDEDTGTPRTLATEVWYPSLPTDEAPWAYDLATEAAEVPGLDDEILATLADLPTIQSNAVRDAAVDGSHGPYPVVVFSHGSYSLPLDYLYLTVHLASHGYVVVAPAHQGNTLWDLLRDGMIPEDFLGAAAARVADMAFVAGALETLDDDPSWLLHGALDTTTMAAVGHSYGGFTALAAPCTDDRFVAAVGLAPMLAMVSGACTLGAYPAPVLVMGATDDQTLALEERWSTYEGLQAPSQRFAVLQGAGHFSFTELCSRPWALGATLEGMPDPTADGCADDQGMPYEDAHAATRHVVTAFLNLLLRGSQASAAYLDAEASPVQGVDIYEGPVEPWP